MGGDSACSTHGWSILNSAPTNSTLAGVLAGFAFTAAVMYVGRAGPVIEESPADPRTAARSRCLPRPTAFASTKSGSSRRCVLQPTPRLVAWLAHHPSDP